MTDYTHLVTDDLLVLDRASNGGTPYDRLVLDIEEDSVSLLSLTVYGSGDGVPESVWHGRRRRYELARGDAVLSLEALRALLAEGGRLATLIDRIIAGLSTDWDGSNMVGTLTDDAIAAEAELEEWLEPCVSRRALSDAIIDDQWAIWDEYDWLAADARGTITAATTDAEIDAYLTTMRDLATSDNVILTGDARDDLIDLRDAKREDAE